MKPLAIELNDRSVSLARDGEVLSSAPSAIFDGSGAEAAGTNAWHALRRQPTVTSTRHLGLVVSEAEAPARAAALVAAELTEHLAKNPPRADERIWITVPVRVDASGLGNLLGIAEGLGLKVDGFVDSAAVTVASLRVSRSALVLEVGLHHAAATGVDSGGQARRRRAISSDKGGLIELYHTWLTFISTAMVKRTRFDPFSNADTEQQLFDALPALTRQAAETGSTTAAVSNGGTRFEVSLTRDQFAEAAQPIYRELIRLLHALRPAGADVTLVIPESVAAYPGLREMLQQFVGCELIAVPEGFAAAATSLLDLPDSQSGEPVRLLRRLPVHEQTALGSRVTREVLGRTSSGAGAPSHVLFDGRAFALGASSLVIGRAPGVAPGGAQGLSLPDGLAGVSRRHCTFVRDGGELVLIDHSHYGTFVNGERVSERVRIHAGDKVRLGEPGIELSLIAIGEVA
ncbi:MAG TPA: FHA domain-containing protein [Steroidobacteraceae bacterium]|nr:FHA domain-containing protein [Steroidobacteraceae bacterium]